MEVKNRDTSFDCTLPVEKWSEEQLEEWARVHITKDTTPQLDWHQRQVAIWARKVLNFSVETLITYQSFEDLLDDFKEYTEQKRISKMLLRKLWAEIEINKPTTHPALSIESQLQNLTLDTYTEQKYLLEYANTLRLRTINEKIAFIRSLRKELAIPFKVGSGPVTYMQMPLLDRREAKETAQLLFSSNFAAFGNTTKNRHFFCTVSAGSGSGKSRICEEMKEWCTEFVKQNPKITSVVTVYIDFSNRDQLTVGETNCELILGMRVAAKALCGCTKSALLTTCADYPDLLRRTFTFDTVMATLRLDYPPGLCAVILVLDEFNTVVTQNLQLSRDILKCIGTYMKSGAPIDNFVIYPVIAGTVEQVIDKQFVVASGFGQLKMALPPLSFDSIKQIFLACLPNHAAWLEDVKFQRVLFLMCSTPHVLESIISIIQRYLSSAQPSEDSIEAITGQITSELLNKTTEMMKKLQEISGFRKLLHFVLAGTPFSLLKTLQAQLIDQLEIQGIIYRRNVGVFLPYHWVHQANETYGLDEYGANLLPLISPSLMPSLGVRFTWHMFELLDHQLMPVRIQALMYVKDTAITVGELLNGAKLSQTLANIKIQLQPIQCATEVEQFIKKNSKRPVALEENIVTEVRKVPKIEFFHYTFLCKTGNPCVDGRTFFKSAEGSKPVMLVKQLKHLQKADTKQEITTINYIQIEHWFNSLQKCLQIFEQEYTVIYLFITNKTITNIPEDLPASLAIVHSENIKLYYGPFVAQFAQLTEFKLEGELEEEESDLDEYILEANFDSKEEI